MAKFANVNLDSALMSGGAGALYYIKETLKSAGWTVLQSGDGTTLYPATDGITTFASGAGGMDNIGAWFRITDFGARREFTFQRNAGAAGSGYAWRIKYSALAKFDGSAPVAGASSGLAAQAASATLSPSAADEQVLIGAGTNAVPTGATVPPSSGGYYAHVIAQSTAEGDVYGFWFFCSSKGAGAINGAMVCEPLRVGSYPAADTDPLMLHVSSSSIPYSSTTGTVYASWYAKGLPAQAWLPLNSGYAPGSAVGSFAATYVGSNPYTGEDDSIDIAYARAVTLTSQGWRGIGKYLRFRGVGRIYPSTANLSTDAYVYVENMLVPWPDNIVPSL